MTVVALILAALSSAADAAVAGISHGILAGSGAASGGDADFGSGSHTLGTPDDFYSIIWDYTPTNGVVVVTARVQGTLYLDRLGSGCVRVKINFEDIAFNSLSSTIKQFCGPGFNANDPKNQLAVDVSSSPDKRLRYVQLVIGSGDSTGTIINDPAVLQPFPRVDVSDRIDNGTADFGNPPHSFGSPSSDGSISLVLLDDGRIKGRVAGTLFWDSTSAGCARMLIDFLDINGATLGGDLGKRQIDQCGPNGGNAQSSSNENSFIKSTLDGAPFERLYKIRLRVGTVSGGNFVNVASRTYSFGDLVGIVEGVPAHAITPVGEDTTYGVQWTVPDPGNWHSLDIIDVRLIDEDGEILRVRWDEAANTFSQFDPRTGRFSTPVQPGSHKKFRSSAVTMLLENSEVDGSGSTGPAVLLRLNLRFANEAAGRTFTVEARAREDSGGVQGWDKAGTITVFPSGGDDENDGDVDKRGEDGK